VIITVNVDDRAWSNGLDRLYVLMLEAGRAGSLAGAEAIRDETKARLMEREHSVITWAPGPPGEPPAMVDGNLMESIEAEMMTEEQAWVGPTDLDYARIQELGGEMHGHPRMVFHKLTFDGLRKFTPEFVELKPRPYLRPSSDDVIDSGMLTEIYIEHWSAAIEEAG
jgi:phage gpG-like protein